MPNYGHLSLSCAFIERPSPLENPAYKVRFFANKHSRKYRQKVTATTLFQTAFHRVFQLRSQTAHVCFRGRKRVTHSAFGERSHTTAYTPKQGAFLPRPQRGLVLPAESLLFHRAFIYIHFPVLCEPSTPAEEKNPAKLPPQRCSKPLLIALFNFSHKRPTFAFMGESGYTHSAFGEKSHTRAYTVKQGPSLLRTQSDFLLPARSLQAE